MNKFTYHSPIGKLIITSNGNEIVSIHHSELTTSEDHYEDYDAVINECIKQLDQYFEGHRKEFDLPLKKYNRFKWEEDFQAHLSKIAFGETITYGELAEKIKNKNLSRHIGKLCNKNPLLLVLPCHRVKAQKGLGGFALDDSIKRQLLEHELKHSGN